MKATNDEREKANIDACDNPLLSSQDAERDKQGVKHPPLYLCIKTGERGA